MKSEAMVELGEQDFMLRASLLGAVAESSGGAILCQPEC